MTTLSRLRSLAFRLPLSAFSLALLCSASAQQTPALVDATTGELKRPTASAFRTANDIQSATGAAASYQPLDADLTSWAAVVRAAGYDTFAATPSSANLRALLTDEVGTGAAYFVGGALGTPASATLTNATGLPISTGVSGLGTGVATLLAGNASGTGGPAGTTSPTFTTPNIGAATGTSVNLSGAGTFGGNLTFGTSGSVLNGTTGSIGLTASGTNQNITLTPSGTGSTLFGASATANGAAHVLNRNNSTAPNSSGTTTTAITRISNQSNDLALDIGIAGNASPFYSWLQARDISNNATSRPLALQPIGGNLLIGTTTDGGAKLDVNGTIRAQGGAAPTSGAGAELFYSSNVTQFLSYDRTGAAWRTMTVGGSPLNLNTTSGGAVNVGTSATVVTFNGTTASTSTTTGALTVAGGVGVAGAGYFGGLVSTGAQFTVSSTTPLLQLTRSSGTDNPRVNFSDGTNSAIFGMAGAASGLVASSVAGDLVARVPSGRSIRFTVDGGTTNNMVIAATTGDLSIASTTEATTVGAGSITTAGGLYAAKKIVSNTGLQVGGTNSTALDFQASARAEIDFLNVVAGSSQTETVTFNGASIGDEVTITPDDLSVGGFLEPLIIRAWVSTANNVNVAVINPTASDINPGPFRFRITVRSF